MRTDSKTVTESIAYILQVMGAILFVVGMVSLIPTAFSFSLPLGIAYLGIIMLLIGAILDRL